MNLREYSPSDCGGLFQLFYDTVHSVNAKDYTPSQLDAWTDGTADLEQWNASFLEHNTVVATENNILVGFGDMDRSGYLDRLFVHKDYQRRGIASAICDRLEAAVNVSVIRTHASITARPFFESRGYRIIKEQTVARRGILLTNYVMEKSLR